MISCPHFVPKNLLRKFLFFNETVVTGHFTSDWITFFPYKRLDCRSTRLHRFPVWCDKWPKTLGLGVKFGHYIYLKFVKKYAKFTDLQQTIKITRTLSAYFKTSEIVILKFSDFFFYFSGAEKKAHLYNKSVLVPFWDLSSSQNHYFFRKYNIIVRP